MLGLKWYLCRNSKPPLKRRKDTFHITEVQNPITLSLFLQLKWKPKTYWVIICVFASAFLLLWNTPQFELSMAMELMVFKDNTKI